LEALTVCCGHHAERAAIVPQVFYCCGASPEHAAKAANAPDRAYRRGKNDRLAAIVAGLVRGMRNVMRGTSATSFLTGLRRFVDSDGASLVFTVYRMYT
jgi:hypothetical protein